MLNKNAKQAAPKKPSKKELKKELERQKSVVHDVLIPILKDASSIRDAQNVLKTMVMVMDYKFNQRMSELQQEISQSKMETLELSGELKDDKKTEYTVERRLIEALSAEEVGTAKGLLQVTEKIIENSVLKETMGRKLETLDIING